MACNSVLWRRREWRAVAVVATALAVWCAQVTTQSAQNYVAATLVRLNDNGAWSWFMDPRVIVHDGKLIAGSVRAVGSSQANVTDPNWGNVEISVYEIETGKVDTVVLHPHLEQDDHDAPALLVRSDGRPYLKFAADGKGTVHFVATEDHPRNFDNSLYHGFLRDGMLYHSNGDKVGVLSTTTDATIATWDFTKVFQADPDHVAWMVDIELDRDARPYVLFSTQRDGRGLPRGQGGMDLRYHYARWNGYAWRHEEIAHAGRRLYPSEDDYAGLAALDPNNPDVAYISTDANPVTGAPLVSAADQKRHYELFRGERDAAGKWTWTPFTRNSTVDNLRPVIPHWNDPRTAIVWMRGTYVHNQGEWYTALVAAIVPASAAR